MAETPEAASSELNRWQTSNQTRCVCSSFKPDATLSKDNHEIRLQQLLYNCVDSGTRVTRGGCVVRQSLV